MCKIYKKKLKQDRPNPRLYLIRGSTLITVIQMTANSQKQKISAPVMIGEMLLHTGKNPSKQLRGFVGGSPRKILRFLSLLPS